MPWVQTTRTLRTWRSFSRGTSSNTVLPLAISSSMTMTSLPVTSPMTSVIDDPVVGEALLGPGGDPAAEHPGEGGGRFGVAEVGGDDDGVGRSFAVEVRRELVQGVQVVDGDAEEPVHLGRVQRHGQDVIGAGGLQQVGHEPAADGDAPGVLLVRARVRVVRDDGGDAAGGGVLGGVEHEQQLDEGSCTGGTRGWTM